MGLAEDQELVALIERRFTDLAERIDRLDTEFRKVTEGVADVAEMVDRLESREDRGFDETGGFLRLSYVQIEERITALEDGHQRLDARLTALETGGH